MNGTLKILAVVLLLGALGFVAWLALGSDEHGTQKPVLPGQGKTHSSPDASGTLGGDPVAAKKNEPTRTNQPPERTGLAVDTGGQSYPQGVIGTVLDGSGYPLPECDVFLTQSSRGTNVLQLMVQKDQGRRFPPVAQGKTDAVGKFQLGVAKAVTGVVYDLWVLHPKHCDFRQNGIEIQSKDKFDVGRIQMRKGATVLGRVSVQGQNLPVAEAIVSIGIGGGQVEIAAPPGRENGLCATVDDYGNYRLDCVSPEGMYTIRAMAPGFAQVEIINKQLSPEQENRFDFELVPGHRIAGVVTDPQGRPVDAAKIKAYALSQKTPQIVEVRADAQGRFDIQGLHQGVFTIVANADGFVEGRVEPVATGKTDVVVTLETQGRVEVQVFGKTGRPLSNYDLVLKTYAAAQNGQEEYFGKGVLTRNVRGARNGKASMTGINPMDYVLEVHAEGHAKGFSSPFKIQLGDSDAPSVIVRLNEGGVIKGVLTDSSGKPVAGAVLDTQPKGFVDNKLVQMFGGVPYKITKSSIRSNQNGEFRMSMLTDGIYQLQITHPEFCTKTIAETAVTAGQTSDLGSVQLDRGALVKGIARVDGQPRGQVRIMIGSVGEAPGGLPMGFEAISDNQGNFVMGKRLPPGRYEVRAGEHQQANAFAGIFQMQKSRQEFTIAPGQESFQLNMNVESLQEGR